MLALEVAGRTPVLGGKAVVGSVGEGTLFSPAASPVAHPASVGDASPLLAGLAENGVGAIEPASEKRPSDAHVGWADAASPAFAPFAGDRAGGVTQNDGARPSTQGAIETRDEGGEAAARVCWADVGAGSDFAADEQQFLSFLAGLAAVEGERGGHAGSPTVVDETESRGWVQSAQLGIEGSAGGASCPAEDHGPALASVQPPTKVPPRRSARAPKPKRPREAPGSDESALLKKARLQQGVAGDKAHGRSEAQQQQQQQQRKAPRIRLTCSGSSDAAQIVAAKRSQRNTSPTASASSTSAKRPRIRLASSAVQQAYDVAAAAATAAATNQRSGAREDVSDDDDDLPLFSIKNKEMEKKHATPEEVLLQLTVGCKVLVKVEKGSKGWPGRVVQLDSDKLRVLVHFVGWNARYDRWVRAKASRISLVAQKREPVQRTRARHKQVQEQLTLKSTGHNVSWLDAAGPAEPVGLKPMRGGFLDPQTCQPRQLINSTAGLRYDLLSGPYRQQDKIGQQLLDLYKTLVASPLLTGSSQLGESELLGDGVHTPTLSASARMVGTLVLRVGKQIVGASTFRFLHCAGESQDDSTLVLEVLGLAVVSEKPMDTNPRQSPLAAFGTRLVNGLKAVAWAVMEQPGEWCRQHAKKNHSDHALTAAASIPRRTTRSQGSRRCFIIAHPSHERAIAFWQAQQLRSGVDADAVASYVSVGNPRLQTPNEESSSIPINTGPMLCMLQPDGSDAPKPPRSAQVDNAAQRELHAATVIQQALRSFWESQKRAALVVARRKAELERQRAAEEAARRQALADVEDIEDTVEDIIRIIVAKAGAAKAKAKRQAKAAARAAALARAKATREANAVARRIQEVKQAAELQAWQAGLVVGSWCIEDETERPGQLTKAPDKRSGVVELLWADTQICSRLQLDDLRAPSAQEQATAVATAKATKYRRKAEEAAAVERARIAAEQEAQRRVAAEVAAAAEQERARLAADVIAEDARLTAAIEAGARAIILEAGDSAGQMTFKGVRSALELRLGLNVGSLQAKKADVKAAIRHAWLHISSNHVHGGQQQEGNGEIRNEMQKRTDTEHETKTHNQAELQPVTAATAPVAMDVGKTQARVTSAGLPAQTTKVKKSKNSKNAVVSSDENDSNHGVWHCVKKAMVRAGAALTSEKVGRLQPGDSFKAIEVRAVDGQLRVRGETGWASVRSLTGNCLLEKR